MTNTRKEIIGLIEDYMDKTLSEWCLVEFMDWGLYRLKEKPFYDEKTNQYYTVTPYSEIENYIRKIIWHYDITALFKFMYANKSWTIYFHNNIISSTIGNDNCYLAYKPLHLYTEQEEQDLLNLLKQL